MFFFPSRSSVPWTCDPRYARPALTCNLLCLSRSRKCPSDGRAASFALQIPRLSRRYPLTCSPERDRRRVRVRVFCFLLALPWWAWRRAVDALCGSSAMAQQQENCALAGMTAVVRIQDVPALRHRRGTGFCLHPVRPDMFPPLFLVTSFSFLVFPLHHVFPSSASPLLSLS